jgi:23S rRNA (uridine2552-2'-O)-methyltransferase
MAPIEGVEFIEGDFLNEQVLEKIVLALGDERVDAVVSDMAPKVSGIRDRDAAESRRLAEAALSLAERVLRPGGVMVVKIFEGADKDEIVAGVRARFSKVQIRKPDASRAASSECYIVAKGYNGRVRVTEGLS